MYHTHISKVNRMLIVCTIVAGWTMPAAAARVDLAEVMPEGALLYLGWSGCEHSSKAAETTAIGKTLSDPQVKRFVEQVTAAVDILLKKGAAESGEAVVYESVKRLLTTLAKRPTGISIVDVGFGEQGPVVSAALVCNLGDDGQAFLQAFNTLTTAKQLPPAQPITVADHPMYQLPAPVPGGLYYGVVKEHFILAFGAGTVEQVVGRLSGAMPALAGCEAVKTARRKIGGDERTRVVTLFVDASRALQVFQMFLPMIAQGDPQTAERLSMLIPALGLDSLQSVCWELHHREGGCFSAAFVQLAGERRGVFAVQSDVLLDDGDLAYVPRDPSWAWAFNLNPGLVYAKVRSTVKQLNPDADVALTAGIAETEGKLGLRLDKDLFDLIGDTVILFDAPESGGLWLTGTVVVMQSPDARQFTQSIHRFVQFLDKQTDDVRVGVSSFDYRDYRIEFVNVIGAPMFLAPAWAVHGDRIIAGLFPQMVMTTLDRLLDGDPKEDSILANADFARGVKVLGGPGVSLWYTDTKTATEELYGLILPLAQTGAAMAQGEGVQVDISAFPTRTALTRHLFAHVGNARVEEDGMLLASYGPTPLALPSIGGAGAMTTPVLVSILLPSLSRARELSKRMVSAANLKGIVMACHIYALDSDGKFPPNLQILVDRGDITEKMLHAPIDGSGKISYVYVPGQSTESNPANVLAHERRDLNDGEGVNVLFVDGHVEFMSLEAFERAMKSTKERLAVKADER